MSQNERLPFLLSRKSQPLTHQKLIARNWINRIISLSFSLWIKRKIPSRPFSTPNQISWPMINVRHSFIHFYKWLVCWNNKLQWLRAVWYCWWCWCCGINRKMTNKLSSVDILATQSCKGIVRIHLGGSKWFVHYLLYLRYLPHIFLMIVFFYLISLCSHWVWEYQKRK